MSFEPSRSSACVSAALTAALVLSTSAARAYSDVFRFGEPAIGGGSEGRWFTGSPADGYTCDVCHEGETANQIIVRGLPDRYAPNVRYDIAVEWPAAVLHVTAVAEITDANGRGVGLAEPAIEPLSQAEICQPIEAQVPAAIILSAPEIELANGRQLIGMQDCGGNVLRWHWTAPPVDVGPVVFAGGVVTPDLRRDATGDRVTSLFKWIGSPSESEEIAELSSGCAAVTPSTKPRASRAIELGLLCSLIASRYRRREPPRPAA